MPQMRQIGPMTSGASVNSGDRVGVLQMCAKDVALKRIKRFKKWSHKDFPTFSRLGFTCTSIFLKSEPGELNAPREGPPISQIKPVYRAIGRRIRSTLASSAPVSFCLTGIRAIDPSRPPMRGSLKSSTTDFAKPLGLCARIFLN